LGNIRAEVVDDEAAMAGREGARTMVRVDVEAARSGMEYAVGRVCEYTGVCEILVELDGKPPIGLVGAVDWACGDDTVDDVAVEAR
jgi:hypothetical protein